MMVPPHLPVALLFQAALCLVASAATNYSIDDQDPLFQYLPFGSWLHITSNINGQGVNMDEDGGHMLATAPGSSATITYTFASVYFLAPLWPYNYRVSTNYAVDGNPPVAAIMQDTSTLAPAPGEPATVTSGVVASWHGTANQQHTIVVTIPAGGNYAIVDMFIFEVLDPSDTSSTISSTSQTSSSTGTTSETASSSSSSSSGTQAPSSGSQGPSSNVERNLAISMGVVGALLAVLLIFLLWRFCIRRKRKSGGNMNPIKSQYHPEPIVPGNGTHVPLEDNSISMFDGATSRYGLGIQNNNLYGPPIIGYDRNSSSNSDRPSTLYDKDQSASSLRTQQIQHDPQKRISSLLMASDRPPIYCRNPNLDEPSPVSSSFSSNSNTNEKNERSPRIPPGTLFTAMAEPEDELTSTAIPKRHAEENVSSWNSGYSRPVRSIV